MITNKDRPHTAHRKILARLAAEIFQACQQEQGHGLVIGHGSGSFGHVAGKKHNTRAGVQTRQDWIGFVEVWRQARDLNELVMEALDKAGLPVIAFPPSALVTATDGQLASWDTAPLEAALKAGLIPVINGDVIFDTQRGGTILSTEELFVHLLPLLHPSRILLAGLEAGVWQDFPKREHLIPEITPLTFNQMTSSIQGSAAVDVTGGMYEKVLSMLSLLKMEPDLKILIFSALNSQVLFQALCGANPGTLIQNQSLGGQNDL